MPTHAAWVDSAGVSGTTISTGRIDLQVQGADAVTTFTALNAAAMYPGDSTAAVLTVRNNGDAPLGYVVTSTATNPDAKGLRSVLAAKVTGDGATTGSGTSVTCAGTALAGTGTSFNGSTLVGSSTARTLAPGASETLCVQATLPSGAAQSFASASTAIGLTFSAVGTVASAWTDAVTVTGTSIGTGTPTAPTVTCGTIVWNGGQAGGNVTLNWTSVARAAGYRLFYDSGASTQDVPSTTTSRTFYDPALGTFWVRTRYPGTWISGNSNTRSYKAASDEVTCS